MEKEFKCIICGAVATTFFLAYNNPMCDICHKKIEEVPHSVEIQYSPGPMGGPEVISVTGTTTTITVSSSPTVFPPGLGL